MTDEGKTSGASGPDHKGKLESGARSSGAPVLALLVPVVLLTAGLALVWFSLSQPPAGIPAPPSEPRVARKDAPPVTPEARRPPPVRPETPRPAAPTEPRAGLPLPGPTIPPEAPATPSAKAPLPFPDLRLPEGPPVAPPATSVTQSAVPPTPWLKLDPATRLERIGVGSCLSQVRPQPIWRAILSSKPQLFLMIGDNVYGDIKSPDLAELAEAYRAQAVHPEFAGARRALAMLGIWDDHDYGRNDGGGSFEHRLGSARLFREYWGRPKDPGGDDGVYYAETFGPVGARVQIIMLDTRSQRSPFRAKGPGFPHWGKYEPDPDPAKTMLGARQWAWLEAELAKPAEIRIVVSSIQVLAEGHGFERWGNLPRERDRLIALIRSTGAKGVVLLSGDRHAGAIYNRGLAGGQILPELTASSLNRSYGPSKDSHTPELLMTPYHPENFGQIDIDWNARTLRLALKGMRGEDVEALTVRFTDLGLSH